MQHLTPAAAIFDKYAEKYMSQYMDVSLYADALRHYTTLLPPNAHILELGCGPGNLTASLLALAPGWQVLATDLSPAMVALAAANNPSASAMVMNAMYLGNRGHRYHGIVCGFLLPYLNQQEAILLLQDCHTCLHHGGILYISLIAGSYATSGIQTSSGGDTLMQYFYDAELITQLLIQAGFSITYTTTVSYPGRDGKQVTDLVVIASKA